MNTASQYDRLVAQIEAERAEIEIVEDRYADLIDQ